MSPHDPIMVTRHEADLQELYKRSLPTWVRAILVLSIASLFGLYLDARSYEAKTFSTKEEMRDLRQELKEMRAEIRMDIKELSGKLEPASQRKSDK